MKPATTALCGKTEPSNITRQGSVCLGSTLHCSLAWYCATDLPVWHSLTLILGMYYLGLPMSV